jgi:hypothetical protein
MATTFVSCVFYYDENVMDTWIKSEIPIVFYVSQSDYDRVSFLTRTSPKIELRELPDVSELEWYRKDDEKALTLPFERNEGKDTMEHLWKMHLKIHCVYLTLKHNNSKKTPYYAYIDFDAPKMFRNPTDTIDSIAKNFGQSEVFVPGVGKPKMFLPGCWGPIPKAGMDLANKIHWRFCGSFFFGGYDAILEFYQYHVLYFSDFLASQNYTMTWEVNFWAYLEWKQDDWKPVWYSANHDDSVIKIPGLFGYKILSNTTTVTTSVYDYPDMSPYRPMSAAYVDYGGKSYINTRYVNYWIYGNGGYYYPEDEGVIRTMNICSELKEEIPSGYDVMREDVGGLTGKTGFSKGIEDVRLYVSRETGKLCFIGSTLQYSYCDKIRLIKGTYDTETHTMGDMQVIQPPQETWCEKNWSPIPLADGTDGFIYKWYPVCEIGRVVYVDQTLGKLEICVRKTMDERFRGMKGSSPFVPYLSGGLIGVVHFSEEKTPRQYFHRVVVLDRETYDVVKCSVVFCFRKPSVEFCIGFKWFDEKFGFWISQMDREPLYLEISAEDIYV